MSILHVKSDTLADFTGTVTLFNSVGSTITGNATDLVRPSDWNSAHSLAFGLGGNTSNASTFGGTDVAFHGGRNVTLAGNATAMSVIGPDLTPYLTTARASNDAIGLATAGSNITATINSAGLSLDARGYAGTGTTFSGTNVSASATLNSAGLNLALSAAAGGGGGLTNINVSAGTTSNNLSAITFGNLNGVSFGLNASTVTASHNGLTTARASNDGVGLNTAQSNVTWTVNSSGLSLDARGYAGTGTTYNGTAINATLALNSAGLAMSLSGVGGTDTWRATGANTIAGTNTSGTFGSDSYIVSGAGAVSVGVSNDTLVVSAPVQSYQPVAVSGSNGSFTASTLTFGNLNGLSFYTSNGSIVGSYTDAGGAGGGFSAGVSNIGNTAGSTGVTGSRLVLAASGELALSQSTDANGATVTIYEPSVPLINVRNHSYIGAAYPSAEQSTYLMGYLLAPDDVSFDWIANVRSVSAASTTVTGTTNNTTFSYLQANTHKVVLYSKMGGASSMSLASMSSSSYGFSYSRNVGIGAQTTQYTITEGMTYPVSGGTSTYSTTYGVSNASLNISTTHLSAFTGLKNAISDFTGTVSKGEYWVAYNISSAQTTQHTAAMSGARILMSYGAQSRTNGSVGSQFGASNNASWGILPGVGTWTCAGGTDVSRIAINSIGWLVSQANAGIWLGKIA